MQLLVLLIIVLLAASSCTAADDDGHRHINEWVVNVDGNASDAARIADESGFHLKTAVPGLGHGYYIFTHSHVRRRHAQPAVEQHRSLAAHPQIRWAQQQVAKKRVKRGWTEVSSMSMAWSAEPMRKKLKRVRRRSSWRRRRTARVAVNDPLWPDMWYLNGRNGQYDMRVKEAWERGFSGRGVVVTILDDGLEWNHDDLAANYDTQVCPPTKAH